MRRIPLIALPILALICPSAPAAAPAKRCYPAYSHGLRSNGEARVYRIGFDIFGCARSNGRRRVIGGSYLPQMSSSGGGGITRMRLAGHYVAVVSVLKNHSGRLAGVTVYNLRTGRYVFDWSAGENTSGLADDADITDLVLRRDGSLAFIEGFHGPRYFQPPTSMAVRRRDGRHGTVLLEASTTIDPSSLALTGRGFQWRSAGALRSATFH